MDALPTFELCTLDSVGLTASQRSGRRGRERLFRNVLRSVVAASLCVGYSLGGAGASAQGLLQEPARLPADASTRKGAQDTDLAELHVLPAEKSGAVESGAVESGAGESGAGESASLVRPARMPVARVASEVQGPVVFAQWVGDLLQKTARAGAKAGEARTVVQGVAPQIAIPMVRTVSGATTAASSLQEVPVSKEASVHGVEAGCSKEGCTGSGCEKAACGKSSVSDGGVLEGKSSCDQVQPPVPEQPIIVAPAAPPVPPSYPFALQAIPDPYSAQGMPEGYRDVYVDVYRDPNQVVYGTPYGMGEGSDELRLDQLAGIEHATVMVPLKSLLATMMAHVENRVRLEFTEQWMAERAMVAQNYQLLMDQNQQLQQQLAMLESRQQIQDDLTAALVERTELAVQMLHRNGVNPQVVGSGQVVVPTVTPKERECETLTASREEWDTIQEDLSNIRRQIALLKRPSPVPFASSAVGTEDSAAATESSKEDRIAERGLVQEESAKVSSTRKRATPYAWPVPYTPIAPRMMRGLQDGSYVPSQATGETGSYRK